MRIFRDTLCLTLAPIIRASDDAACAATYNTVLYECNESRSLAGYFHPEFGHSFPFLLPLLSPLILIDSRPSYRIPLVASPQSSQPVTRHTVKPLLCVSPSRRKQAARKRERKKIRQRVRKMRPMAFTPLIQSLLAKITATSKKKKKNYNPDSNIARQNKFCKHGL